MIEGSFKGFEGPETVGFGRLSSLALVGTGREIHYAVEALDDSGGKLPFGVEVI